MLSEADIDRYSRHILLREIGGRGQRRLRDATVRVVGPLDAPARACLLWLARSGVGRLLLPVDARLFDGVDAAGLLLRADVGRPLTEAVRARLLFHQSDMILLTSDDIGATVEGSLDIDPGNTVESGVRAALDLVKRIGGGRHA